MLAICASSSFITFMMMIDLLGMTEIALVMTAALIAWKIAMGVFIHKRLHLMPGLFA
jgi:hypothetical protein